MIRFIVFFLLVVRFLYPAIPVQSVQAAGQAAVEKAPLADVSAYELIAAMNTLRVSNGLPALKEDPIINAVASATAQTMAANQMSSHIGDVSGRLAGAGYGGGAKVWATENFAVGSNHTIDQIMLVWADAAHMIPAVNPAYCHVGAGTAKSSNGRTYYVLQAAYIGGQACGDYKPSPGGGGQTGGYTGVSQVIVPVKVATPDADGRVFHEVQAGQSFWSIAIAYKITILDLQTWNNLTPDTKLQVGQKLFIPSSNTEGYATPTPVGMVLISDPDEEGKIIHSVQPYQTLFTIAQAYHVQVNTLLALNGWQEDWPLQIGQKLLVSPGKVTPTPENPLYRLTPEADGKYYHVVQSGETLSWIANQYKVTVNELMFWNGMNESSILYPEQKLVLVVTPPATNTPTAAPATDTPVPPMPSPSQAPTLATASPTAITAAQASALPSGATVYGLVTIAALAGGLVLAVALSRKKT